MKRHLILSTIFLVIFLFPTRAALSQTDTVYEAWVARHNGSGNFWDMAYDLAVDASGNVYVTGNSDGSKTYFDYATIKYDASGVQRWLALYDGPSNGFDYARALVVDPSGNVYVTGFTDVFGTGFDYATIKYNASGVRQWVAIFSGLGYDYPDYARAIAVDASGNVYVTGYSWSTVNNSDYATIKYDASGVQQWVARYNGSANTYDDPSSLAVDASGNVYVTGYSTGPGTSWDYATIKYDASGVQQWVARYSGPGNSYDDANDLAVDASGNVYVTGASNGSTTANDYATIKYDASGVQQWIARYNGSGNDDDASSTLAVDASWNVYITGYSTGSGTFWDYATIKYDASGVQLWVARYNGPGNSYDDANDLAVDASGNVYVTGDSWDSVTLDDYATIKYDASGVQQWVVRYNGTGNEDDAAYDLAVDASGNVYVTGESIGSGTSWDYATIKYQQTASVVSVGVTLDPPSGDGSFNYDLTFTNNTDSSLAGDIWTEMFGPGGGHKVGQVVTGKTLEGNRSYVESGSAGVGESAPLGEYTFTVNVGQYPGVVLGSGSAMYSKTSLEKEGSNLAEAGPAGFELFQNHPNPFNPSTTIRYGLPSDEHVRLEVFNTLGQRVATLVDEEQTAGYHEAVFENNNLASGVYLYRLVAGEFNAERKLMLLR